MKTSESLNVNENSQGLFTKPKAVEHKFLLSDEFDCTANQEQHAIMKTKLKTHKLSPKLSPN